MLKEEAGERKVSLCNCELRLPASICHKQYEKEGREGNLQRHDTFVNLSVGVSGVRLMFLVEDKDR